MHALRRWISAFFVMSVAIAARSQVVPPMSPPAPALADSDKPLPDVQQLLEDVEKHEDRDDKILQQYTYHSHVVTEEFDGNDSVKKTSSRDLESIPVQGVRVNKLVARDGKPLSPDEAQKVDAQFDKAVERAKKNRAHYQEKRAQAEQEGKSNQDFILASRVLQLGDFSNERRVIFNGRPTIVLDFVGKKNAKTHNESEKVIEDLQGTAWIDEQDKVLARAEGHFVQDFKVGLGLIADIHKGLSFTMEQQKINGEVWLPHIIDGQGKASIGIFLRVHGHTHAEMSDYRKFRASATIVSGGDLVGDDGQPLPATPEPPAPDGTPLH